MLLEFTVRNFLSIKDEVTLNMVASKDDSFKDNTFVYENGKSEKRALKTAVLYGSNASGKTNILKAMGFVSALINKSHEMQQGRMINRMPFKLDRRCLLEPSEFKIVFMHESIKYLYMFSVTETEVVEECLYYYPNGRQSTIFERNKDEYKFTVDIERQAELKQKFHSKNKLFISTESLWEYEKAKAPFKWLSEYFNVFIDHKDLEGYTRRNISGDADMKGVIKKYLKFADFDIEDIFIENKKKDDVSLIGVFDLFEDENDLNLMKNITDDVQFIHKGIDEKGKEISVPLKLSEESDGTQKYFGILGPFLEVLKNGYTIVIDELDIRLHTLLVIKLVQLFLNPNINKNNAQLIFSTHDTNLLDEDILRRDQIWFVEKKKDRSTDLYSLYDFGGVRKSERIEKGYLQGKYGAIPFFKGDLK